jgi:hypothetical protein
MVSRWREAYRREIEKMLLNYEAECLSLGKPLSLKKFKDCLAQWGKANVPGSHPYKVWCSERRVTYAFFGELVKGAVQSQHYSIWSRNYAHKKQFPKQSRKTDGQLTLL